MDNFELSNLITSQHPYVFELAVALLLGALIGLQRGWIAREKHAGERVAGMRTHALVGLMGGVSVVLAERITFWFLPAALITIAAISISAYRARAAHTQNFSITGIIGLLLAFCFGALAASGELILATMSAVITTVILDNKEEIHKAIRKLQERELDAALKLLMISLVILPLLPNQGMGPGNVLNPYEIWWMVVLIASISFVGYFSVRIAGTQKGILFTSLFAGLSSSTALTLHFARISSQNKALSPLLSAGILIACGTMYPRILLYCLVISPALFNTLVFPIMIMAMFLYCPAIYLSFKNRKTSFSQPPSQNPLDLKSAIILGTLLVVVLVLSEWLRRWFGDSGIYMLAAASGITDVDAITLSLTRLSDSETITSEVAATGIVIAASVNNLFKISLALIISKKTISTSLAIPMLLSTLSGFVAIYFLILSIS
jgi:uncharacterized membrane protein (DUF4010 family)